MSQYTTSIIGSKALILGLGLPYNKYGPKEIRPHSNYNGPCLLSIENIRLQQVYFKGTIIKFMHLYLCIGCKYLDYSL